MRLLAISDLHLGHPTNRQHLASIGRFPDDWLILAGDVGETCAHLQLAFELLRDRFAAIVWVPGNHELWAVDDGLRGEERYFAMVELARSFDVVTPEDSYPQWPGTGEPTILAPLFTLYDYSFRPDHITEDTVLAWAAEGHAVCADEMFLDPVPYHSRAAWCRMRLTATETRLSAIPASYRTVLISHFPFRQVHAHLPRVPRFSPWCGARGTEDWPRRFRARAAVYGHLHIRRSFREDETVFHEVSLGYPRQWDQSRAMSTYLRHVL